jgi:dephospho-CoA kinase
MLVVGLTGGIGCGKTTIAELFSKFSVPVIDTDEIAHGLTGAGGQAIPAIRDEFGAKFICADGRLDRAAMRGKIFSDPSARNRLEAILHPLIKLQARSRLAAVSAPYLLLVVPLLIEKGGYDELVERILVVDCSRDVQIARTMERSNLSRDEILRILAVQADREVRLARADDVIQNEGALEDLDSQVEALHAKYLSLAAANS